MLPGLCWCDSSLSSQFPLAHVAQSTERDASNIEDEGESPSASANFSRCNVRSSRPRLELGGHRCNSRHPDHFWKAGRYKLAALVSKTRSARAEVGDRRLPPDFQPLNERKSHETSPPLSKPVALPQELQTQSCPPHPSDQAALQLSSGALRSETTNQNV